MSINSIGLVGRVGNDPDIKYFESGSVVCKFSLAVTRPTKSKETDWFTIELWNQPAEIASSYVRKGSLVGISGSLSFEAWDDRTSGERRVKPVIKADPYGGLDLLGSGQNREAQSNRYDDDEF